MHTDKLSPVRVCVRRQIVYLSPSSPSGDGHLLGLWRVERRHKLVVFLVGTLRSARQSTRVWTRSEYGS